MQSITLAVATMSRPYNMAIIHCRRVRSRQADDRTIEARTVWTRDLGAGPAKNRKGAYFFFFLGNGNDSQRMEIISLALRLSEKSRI